MEILLAISVVIISIFLMWYILKPAKIRGFYEILMNPHNQQPNSLMNSENGKIDLLKNGINISMNATNKVIYWNDILSIVAYKIDLITTDVIALGLKLDNQGSLVEIHEEMIGFKMFCTEMHNRY